MGAVEDPGDVVLEVHAVGDVKVEIEVRPPAVECPDERAQLRRIELGVVAVEIQVLGGGAPAAFLGASLVDPGEAGESLVSVRGEHRDEEEVRPAEERALRAAHRHVAQEHEPGVFPVHLTRMDAGLGEERGFAAGVKRLLREGSLLRRDDHPDVAPLGALAQRNEAQLRRGGDEALEVGDCLVVAGRALESGLLGRRCPTVPGIERQRETLPLPRDHGREHGTDLAGHRPTRGRHEKSPHEGEPGERSPETGPHVVLRFGGRQRAAHAVTLQPVIKGYEVRRSKVPCRARR